MKHCYLADPSIKRNGTYQLTKVDSNGQRCSLSQISYASFKDATKAAEKKNKRLRIDQDEIDLMIEGSIDEKGDVIDTVER